jgi:hypothetical protein
VPTTYRPVSSELFTRLDASAGVPPGKLNSVFVQAVGVATAVTAVRAEPANAAERMVATSR